MISLCTSIYKSHRYLKNYSRNLDKFAHFLKENNVAFEIIVIANDADDQEKQLEQQFKNETWFRFISIPLEPLYATWNRGVGIARGDVIGFWNVDDIRYPEALVEAEKLFGNGAELTFFPFKISRYLNLFGYSFLVNKQLIDKQIPQYNEQTCIQFQKSMLCGPFFMFTKELYKKAGPFDEQFKIAGDFDWCIRAAKQSGKLIKGKTIAGEFRVDGNGLSAGNNECLVVENNIIYQRHGILEKIKRVPSRLLANYDPTTIKCRSGNIKYV